jgi:hypothetical protein
LEEEEVHCGARTYDEFITKDKENPSGESSMKKELAKRPRIKQKKQQQKNHQL